MQDFTIGDLGVFIGTIGGVITSILVIIQKSKCIKLDFCGCHCVRDINELKKDERLNFLNISKFEEIIYGFFNNKDYKLSYQIWSFYVFFKWFNKYKKYINS